MELTRIEDFKKIVELNDFDDNEKKRMKEIASAFFLGLLFNRIDEKKNSSQKNPKSESKKA